MAVARSQQSRSLQPLNTPSHHRKPRSQQIHRVIIQISFPLEQRAQKTIKHHPCHSRNHHHQHLQAAATVATRAPPPQSINAAPTAADDPIRLTPPSIPDATVLPVVNKLSCRETPCQSRSKTYRPLPRPAPPAPIPERQNLRPNSHNQHRHSQIRHDLGCRSASWSFRCSKLLLTSLTGTRRSKRHGEYQQQNHEQAQTACSQNKCNCPARQRAAPIHSVGHVRSYGKQ